MFLVAGVVGGMARQEADREDLLRDATAFTSRAMLSIPTVAQEVFLGFRADGCFSIYLGPSPVYQFNSDHQLRRAHQGIHLFKAEEHRLVRLTRNRSEGRTELVRSVLSVEQTARFVRQVQQDLHHVAAEIRDKRFVLVGQVPSEQDVAGRFLEWLDGTAEITVADSPNVV